MEIHEITCSADADTFMAEYVRKTHLDTDILDKMDEEIEEWVEEFDKIERQVKFRGDDNVNHYQLNKIIGLHFLIPTAEFYINKWRVEKAENGAPLHDDNKNLREQYSEEQQRLWDDDSLFDSEPE